MKVSIGILLASIPVAIYACSDRGSEEQVVEPVPARPGSGGSQTDASAMKPTDSGSPTSMDASPPDCNEVMQLGNDITAVYTAAQAPSPEGGTISDGTYVLTAVTRYNSPDGGAPNIVPATTVVIQNGVEQWMETRDGGIKRATFTLVTNGASLTATPTCSLPVGFYTAATETYTITPTTFTTYSAGAARVMTKQ